jgi:hypothetical protein
MPLNSLSKFDIPTANAVLAAAALSTAPNPGIGEEEFETVYRDHVGAVLSEIRQKLGLTEDDDSLGARISIDRFLSNVLDETLLPGDAAEIALARAGQSGLLSPGVYKVVQPDSFQRIFFLLAVTKSQVKEAIHEPDDYQHLMTENALVGEDDIFSISMKQSPTRRNIDPNWLLVQSFRRGLEQVAQSAWRIFPSDVDLRNAREPVDVLRAFAESFGINVVVGDKVGKFIDRAMIDKSPFTDEMSFQIRTEAAPGGKMFSSWSHRKTTNPSIFHVGLAYCIDLTKYRASLIAHGSTVGTLP